MRSRRSTIRISLRKAKSRLCANLLVLASAFAVAGCLSGGGGTNPVDSFIGSSTSATGSVGNAAFEFNPVSHDFGNVSVGSSSTTTVTITNTSAISGTITGITFSNSNYSLVSSTCTGTLTTLSSCSATVRFSPTSGGTISGALLLNYSAAGSGLSFQATMGLSGTGISAVAFAGLDSIDQVTGTTMRLNWTHVAGAATYTVYRMVAGSPVFVATVSAPTALYTVTGLIPATNYTFRVIMTDTNGLQDGNIVDRSAVTNTISATFNGWSHVKAVGAKTVAPQSPDLAAAGGSVTLTWAAVTLSSGSVDSYNIYRSTTAGAEDFSTPLSTGIVAGTRSYTDSTAVAGTTYYYNIAPVVSGTVIPPSASNDREIKVIAPPANMVLMHRWMANQEMCTLMGKVVDRDNNYRCATTAPGSDGTYLDFGHSLFVDMFEQGCNYTYDPLVPKCGSADGCIVITGSPVGNVVGNLNDILYEKMAGHCYINTNGGTGWTYAGIAVAPQLQLMGSNQAGLPPFVRVPQASANTICNGQTIAGFAGTKRLLKRTESIALAAADPSHNDVTINAIENSNPAVDLDTLNYCNTVYAAPQSTSVTDLSISNPTMAFEDVAYPAATNRDTLPGCLTNTCAGGASRGLRSLRTGSNATSLCETRYGARDVVGNVNEWTSGQITCDGATCTGVAAASNSVNTSDADFEGVNFDGNQAPAATTAYTTNGNIQLPIAIPIVNAGFGGDGVLSWAAAQFHGDRMSLVVTANTYGVLSGGGWGSNAGIGGRYVFTNYSSTSFDSSIGFRCAFEAD